ncbi:class I SAM-dependent methyltransferase [Desulfocurvus sp. DL9XJH121]
MDAPDAKTVLRDARAWYDGHARDFCEQTARLPMERAYEAFLPLVPRGGRILDAGCGGGRDSLHFLEQGYRVEALDASPEMARLAGERTGLAVRVGSVLELADEARFHGVFANASLLHVAPRDMGAALERLGAALRPGGVLFMSLKQGRGGYLKDGVLRVWRYDEDRIRALMAARPELELLRTASVPDTRAERAGESWLHVLAVKRADDAP